MARVNIEDRIYRDERFHKLSAFHTKPFALGLLVMAWDLAHYWFLKHPEGLIPFEQWKNTPEFELLEKYGLAERKENGIYVKGSKDQCEYLKERQEAGRKGGLISQGKKSSKLKQTKQNQPSSSSSSSKGRENILVSSEDSTETDHLLPTPIGLSLHEKTEAIYKQYPKRIGTNKKGKAFERIIKKASDGDWCLDNALAAVKNYKIFCDENNKTGTEFVMQFITFFDPRGDWMEWINFESESTIKKVRELK